MPFSLIILPIALIYVGVQKNKSERRVVYPYAIFILLVTALCLSLAAYSATKDPSAYLHAFQWVIPFFWFIYFWSLLKIERFNAFMRGFFFGALFGAAYTFFAGFLEILRYGSLMDSGRMTQNLVLPGHYQLYVYVPTIMAYSSLIAIAAHKTKVVTEIRRPYIWGLYGVTVMALLFTGAREGILVFALGILGMYGARNAKKMLFLTVLGLVCAVALSLSFSGIMKDAARSNYRIANKIAALDTQGGEYGGRDVMVERYLKIIEHNPFVGNAMEQPEAAPSAHNYYVDSFAWGGCLLFAAVITITLATFLRALKNLVNGFGKNEPAKHFSSCIAIFAVLFLCVSNNINVPLRQPLTGSIGAFLIFFVISAPSVKRMLRGSAR